MYRGNGTVDFDNCHVAAQIDVYNDVCGNYQYYWYRYAGMLIGSIRGKNKTDSNGYVVPNTDGITANSCTVHFGDWNNYYYCELVANSLASYTHDHQMSRLVEVAGVNAEAKKYLPLGAKNIEENWVAIPTDGRYNYVIVNGEHATENATCYHFVNGQVWDHEQDGGTEVIDGVEVFKEDKQHIYLPFNQLIQGDGWGVKHIPIYNEAGRPVFEGIVIRDNDEVTSTQKFEVVGETFKVFTTGQTVDVSDLFAKKEADGVVIGALSPDGSINWNAMDRMITAADGMWVTLHRAFDMCKEPYLELERCMEHGISCILTSGQENLCIDGMDCLKELVDRAGNRIQILIGSGVSADVIAKVYEETGAKAYHMSGKEVLDSEMIYRKDNVYMGLDGLSEYSIWRTKKENIEAAVSILECL